MTTTRYHLRPICKQEVTGSIPVGSTRKMPANTPYLPRAWLLGRRSWASDGSLLEAVGLSRVGCSVHPSPRATPVRPARAPSRGGGAPGLTAFCPNRSGGEARAEALHLAAAEVDSKPRATSQSARAAHAGRASALLDESAALPSQGRSSARCTAAALPRSSRRHERG